MSGTSQVSELGATQSVLSVASAHYRRSVIDPGNSSRKKLSSRKKSTRHLADELSRTSHVQSTEGANDLGESVCLTEQSNHSPPNQHLLLRPEESLRQIVQVSPFSAEMDEPI